jgi:predicted AlkP superfamily phosphohydrolase/phosphomutase
MEQGELPLLKRLAEHGVSATLLSTIPPFTIPAWNVMTSGRSPGDIGCFSTIQKVPGEYRWQPYYLIHEQPCEVWDYASSAGLDTLVMNFPNVHEPYPTRGLMSAGWLFSDPTHTTHPTGLKDELDRLVGGYEIDTGDPKLFHGGDEEFLDAVARVAVKQARAAAALLTTTRFPLVMVAFVGPDRAQHRCWFQQPKILRLYQRLEEGLGELLEALGDEYNILCVSDHGFGPATRRIRLNQWLLDCGYLVVKQSTRRLRGRAVEVLKSAGLEPLLRRVAGSVPNVLGRALTKHVEPVTWENLAVDWTRTRAFTDSDWGYVYLNVKGREPEGAVPAADCSRLKDEIAAGLADLVDPVTGVRLGGRVRPREDVYTGRYLSEAPDLVIESDDAMPAFMSKVGYSGCVAREHWGSHRREGILLASGPDIPEGRLDRPVAMTDVAPTVLHMLGLAVPDDMRGEIRLDLVRSSLAERPVKRCPPAQSPRRMSTRANEADLARRLRAIGYLE